MVAEPRRRIDRAMRDAGLPPLERSVWVEVDVDVLSANFRSLGSLTNRPEIAAVVKADGYGHGLEMAARCAVAGGARWLCVADSAEATRLRTDGYRGRIFVLYPVPGATLRNMARLGIDVTIGSVRDAEVLMESLAPNDPLLAAHLEIDTGMTRGGLSPVDAVEVALAVKTAPSASLVGVWTHLASPENARVTANQVTIFDSVLSRLADAGIDPEVIHAAASGGMLVADTDTHDLVRPGLAFYGLHPGAGPDFPPTIRPALAVRANPVRIAAVSAGTSVGYGGTWTAERDSVLATLPIGYADGWSRSSSPGTSVLVEGARAPVVGRVSSDSLTVDITTIRGVGSDSEFTLLGLDGEDEITADEIAVVRDTISWEVLQQLSPRLSRVYMADGAVMALRPEMRTEVIASSAGVTLPGY